MKQSQLLMDRPSRSIQMRGLAAVLSQSEGFREGVRVLNEA